MTSPTRQQKHNNDRTSPLFLPSLLAWCAIIFIRILVGYQSHSGQDNHHGAAGAYGGDFEAQRHWMELTWQLPSISQWYTYDLAYWGLDYPPLSAYQSFLCGALSHILVGPDSVALDTSRGYEDATHKAFMRGTVLVLDVLIYGTAVWNMTETLFRHNPPVRRLTAFVMIMLQPSILLMDHGHFQYNTTALGLTLWALFAAAQGRGVFASIAFAAALSFKQMTLYYAPAIFAYLLGTCFPQQQQRPKTQYVPNNHTSSSSFWTTFSWIQFIKYGIAVIGTTALIWGPLILAENGPDDDDDATTSSTPTGRLVHILKRIFPLHRGLFEDKVANLWCALSVKPLRLAQRIPTSLQPLAALLVTLALSLPACIRLFQWGRLRRPYNTPNTTSTDAGMTTHIATTAHHFQIVLLGASSVALSFFLGAFHVHEKSILMALAPASVAIMGTPLLDWFTVTSTWSLFPLLILDRLPVAYFCLLVVYVCGRCMTTILGAVVDKTKTNTTPLLISWPQVPSLLQHSVVAGSTCILILLHIAQAVVSPPPNLPDLFAVLWSIAGCGFFVATWMGMVWYLYSIPLTSWPRLKGD